MSEAIPYVTVLMGDDSISRERARDDLVAAIRAEHSQVDEEHFDSDRSTMEQFVEQVLTPSMFMATRIFIIKHAGSLDAKDLDALRQVVAHRIPDVYVIIEDEAGASGDEEIKDGKRFSAWLGGIVKKAGAKAAVVDVKQFPKPRDWEIAKWLVDRTPQIFGRIITRADAERFVDLVGYDFDKIFSELQKLDIYLPPDKPIDRAGIGRVIEGSRSMTARELAQSLAQKDLVRALEIVDSLCSTGFYAPSCIGALFTHFWALFRIRCFDRLHPGKVTQFLDATRGRDIERQSVLGLEIGVAAGLMTEKQAKRVFPVLVKPGVVDQAMRFTERQLRRIIKWLGEYDVGIKTGRIADGKTYLQLFCYRVARIAEAGEA